MTSVEKSIEVSQPLSVVYDQWTQFENYPFFMTGVQEVCLTDGRKLHWRAIIEDKEVEWDAEIIEWVTGEKIGWRTGEGPQISALVQFRALNPDVTRVTLQLIYEATGILAHIEKIPEFVSAHAEGVLRNFKKFSEEWSSSIADKPAGNLQ